MQLNAQRTDSVSSTWHLAIDLRPWSVCDLINRVISLQYMLQTNHTSVSIFGTVHQWQGVPSPHVAGPHSSERTYTGRGCGHQLSRSGMRKLLSGRIWQGWQSCRGVCTASGGSSFHDGGSWVYHQNAQIIHCALESHTKTPPSCLYLVTRLGTPGTRGVVRAKP